MGMQKKFVWMDCSTIDMGLEHFGTEWNGLSRGHRARAPKSKKTARPGVARFEPSLTVGLLP